MNRPSQHKIRRRIAAQQPFQIGCRRQAPRPAGHDLAKSAFLHRLRYQPPSAFKAGAPIVARAAPAPPAKGARAEATMHTRCPATHLSLMDERKPSGPPVVGYCPLCLTSQEDQPKGAVRDFKMATESDSVPLMQRGSFSYLWLVIKTAWRHSFHAAHSVILGLIIAGGLLSYFVPRVHVMVDLHGWQVATVVLGSIIAVRLILAPYWIWQEQERSIIELRADRQSLPDKRMAIRRIYDKAHAIRDALLIQDAVAFTRILFSDGPGLAFSVIGDQKLRQLFQRMTDAAAPAREVLIQKGPVQFQKSTERNTFFDLFNQVIAICEQKTAEYHRE